MSHLRFIYPPGHPIDADPSIKLGLGSTRVPDRCRLVARMCIECLYALLKFNGDKRNGQAFVNRSIPSSRFAL